MLNKYKYKILLIKYLKLLKPKLAKTITIDIKTLIKKSSKELIFINNNKILKPPINAPIIILINLVFLLSIKDTPKRSKKSKKKLSIIIKSI